jgi:hypothetical protein
MGRLIELSGTVPLTDPFAFTAKQPQWVDHEWLSGVVFWWLAKNFGDPGLLAFQFFMVSMSCVYLARAIQLRSPGAPAAVIWLSICMLEASFTWASIIRCQAFTYLFLPVLYVAFLEYTLHNRVRHLLLIPFIFFIWANAHGGFALGLIVLAMFTGVQVLQKRRALLPCAILAASVAVTAFNPYGFVAYWHYILEALTMDRPKISEWAPLHHDSVGIVVAAVLGGLVLTGILVRRKTNDLLAMLLILFSTYCAFRHIRLEAFMMVTIAAWGASYVSEVGTLLKRTFPVRTARLGRVAAIPLVVLAAVVGIIVANRIARLHITHLSTALYPVEACHWLRSTQPPGSRVLVGFNHGSFALWRLYPNALISMDGRYEEVYRPETFTLNYQALEFKSPEAKAALEAIKPTHILAVVDKGSEDALSALGEKWVRLYKDADFQILALRSKSIAGESPIGPMPGIWEAGF